MISTPRRSPTRIGRSTPSSRRWYVPPHRSLRMMSDVARKAGWSDEALYDAITVCSLFQFYNNWIDATGVADMPALGYEMSGHRLATEGYASEDRAESAKPARAKKSKPGSRRAQRSRSGHPNDIFYGITATGEGHRRYVGGDPLRRLRSLGARKRAPRAPNCAPSLCSVAGLLLALALESRLRGPPPPSLVVQRRASHRV